MTISIRTSLGLLAALLLLMAAGSDQLQAQGTPGAGGAGQPPSGAQQMPQMPPGGMNAGAGNKKNFEQSDVPISGSDEGGVGSGEALQTMLPYIALIVVVVIGAGIYFMKQSSGAPAADSRQPVAEEPAAEEPAADAEPIADDEGGIEGDGGE